MSNCQETTNLPQKNPSIDVDSVLERVKRDTTLGISFLSKCQSTYNNYPESIKNELMNNIQVNISSLDRIVGEGNNVFDTFIEAWNKTALYFQENLNLANSSDNTFMDYNATKDPKSTQKNLTEMILSFLVFSEKAVQSTKLEQTMFAESKEYINNLKEAVEYISSDVKSIQSLKEEIKCGCEEALNEVNKVLRIASTYDKCRQPRQETQADEETSEPTRGRGDLDNQSCGTLTLKKGMVESQPPKKCYPVNQGEKNFEEMVIKFGNMSTKARTDLEKNKKQNEDIQQTVTSIKKS